MMISIFLKYKNQETLTDRNWTCEDLRVKLRKDENVRCDGGEYSIKLLFSSFINIMCEDV